MFLHMGTVEILLLWVVGFSVVLFLFVQNLEKSNKNGEEEEEQSCDSNCKTRTKPLLVESVEEATSVSAIEDSQEKVFVENNSDFQETQDDAVSEHILNLSSEKSDGISTGNDKDSIFRDKDDCEMELLDDWEGIERTELEKEFGKAVVFLSSDNVNEDLIGEDLRLQLYGLQNIVLEGPCHGSQPMMLKVSARAKWNAWQKLGDISREMAMEKFVAILSETIPDWKMNKIFTTSDQFSV